MISSVDTPAGPGRLFFDLADRPRAILVLGHGAGGGVEAADLAALAHQLPRGGVSVVRFEQPWRTAGKRVAAPPPRLDLGWRAAVDSLTGSMDHRELPLFFGGRSAGARVACRTAVDYPVAGVVCLAFPLHPPARPDRSRIDELKRPHVPRLVLQGTKDAFGGPAEIRAQLGSHGVGVTVVELPDADHGFRVTRAVDATSGDLRALLCGAVARFIDTNAI